MNNEAHREIIEAAFKRYHMICKKQEEPRRRKTDQASLIKGLIAEEYRNKITHSEYYRNLRHLKFYRERGNDDHFSLYVDVPTHLANHPFVIDLKTFLSTQYMMDRVKSQADIEILKEDTRRVTLTAKAISSDMGIVQLPMKYDMPAIFELVKRQSSETSEPLFPNDFLDSINNIKF